MLHTIPQCTTSNYCCKTRYTMLNLFRTEENLINSCTWNAERRKISLISTRKKNRCLHDFPRKMIINTWPPTFTRRRYSQIQYFPREKWSEEEKEDRTTLGRPWGTKRRQREETVAIEETRKGRGDSWRDKWDWIGKELIKFELLTHHDSKINKVIL